MSIAATNITIEAILSSSISSVEAAMRLSDGFELVRYGLYLEVNGCG